MTAIRNIVYSTLVLLPSLPCVAQKLTAEQAIAIIHQKYPTAVPNTVDTVKAGDLSTRVNGIATTFLDTMDVLREANKRGLNLIITHEPTFYNHRDDTTFFKDDSVYREKLEYIEQNHMVVFRLHDEIHEASPDPIAEALLEALGWRSYATRDVPFSATIPQTTLGALAATLQAKLHAETMRVVGDPGMKVVHVALRPGAAGLQEQVKALRQEDVDLLIAGESSEWETVEYVRDAGAQGRHKALILLGHEISEEPGMAKCAEYLRTVFPNIKVEHVSAGNPLWNPQSYAPKKQ